MDRDRYTEDRIAALKRNGAIAALRGEAKTIRDNLVTRFNESERNKRMVDYDAVAKQLDRARAFDVAAQELDNERPAGAAGLAS